MTNEQKLDKISDDLNNAINEGVQTALEQILYEAEKVTPVQTGNLLNHWKMSKNKVYNDCEYADFVIPDIFEDINAEEILVEEVEKELERQLK